MMPDGSIQSCNERVFDLPGYTEASSRVDFDFRLTRIADVPDVSELPILQFKGSSDVAMAVRGEVLGPGPHGVGRAREPVLHQHRRTVVGTAGPGLGGGVHPRRPGGPREASVEVHPGMLPPAAARGS